jgi:prephenate dehydrogenase
VRYDRDDLETLRVVRVRHEGKGVVLELMRKAAHNKNFAVDADIDHVLAVSYVEAARRRKKRKHGRRTKRSN